MKDEGKGGEKGVERRRKTKVTEEVRKGKNRLGWKKEQGEG